MYPFLHIGNLKLPMYSAMIVLGTVIAFFMASYDCKRKKLSRKYLLALASTSLFVSFIGAKILYFIVTYKPNEILNIFKEGNWLWIISGGYVFYGGFVFGILTFLVMSKILHCKMSEYANVLVKAIPLAYAFGRIGCFCAGCCYGMPSDSILGVVFENPIGLAPVGVKLFPIQLFECVFNLLLTILLWWIDLKCSKKNILVPLYFLTYSVERFVIEFFRYDLERGIYCGLSTSQWISAAFFIAGLVLLIFRGKSENKKL